MSPCLAAHTVCVSVCLADKGIQTGPDSKYFALYSELKKPFTNDNKELVLQVGAQRGLGRLPRVFGCVVP